jgi:hypothetical protein
MNDITQHVRDGVHQADVSADGHVSAVARRRRQSVYEIGRRRVLALTQVGIEFSSRLQAGLLIGGESILRPQASRRAALVLVVPIPRRLAIAIRELCVFPRSLIRPRRRSSLSAAVPTCGVGSTGASEKGEETNSADRRVDI